MKRYVLTSYVLAGSLLLTACASSDAHATSAETGDQATTAETATSETSAATTAAPSTGYTTDDHLNWILEGLRSPDDVEPREIERRFSQQALNELPPEAFIETILRPLAGPWTIATDNKGLTERNVVIEMGEQRLNLTLAIDDEGKIVRLFFSPPTPEPENVSVESVDAAFAAAGPSGGYGLFDTSSGSCVSLHNVEGDVAQPIGSEFKLWVLAAVAEQIIDGELSWDEEITLTKELRSLPAQGVAAQEDGAKISVAKLASLMISISDNTATDLLMDRVGRKSVEQAMVNANVADPSLNIPMLTTRELFLLKFVEAHAKYPSLGPEEKRDYLNQVLADDQSLPTIRQEELPEPPWNIDHLEWYASPIDLCQTYLYLTELGEAPGMGPLHEALAAPREGVGSSIDRDRWPTAWYKGGSEPGVLAMSWYLRDSEESSYVAAGAINNPDVELSQFQAGAALQQMITLVENMILPDAGAPAAHSPSTSGWINPQILEFMLPISPS